MIQEFLSKLRCKGTTLWLEDERLKFKSHKNAPLSGSDRQLLQVHKAEVIQWLQDNPDFFQYRPLSDNQRSLWVVYQMAPDSAAYNLTHAVSLGRSLNLDCLQQAFAQLCQRHSILRTAYTEIDAQPLQYKVTDFVTPWSVQQVRDYSHQAIVEHCKQEADKPFDLAAGDVCRGHLLLNQKDGKDEAIFQLTVHHIAADFWSCEVLFDQLLNLYITIQQQGAEAVSQAENEVVEDYFSWAAQQCLWSHSDAAQAAQDYWLQTLGPDVEPLQLPTDKPRPPVQSYNGEVLSFAIESDLANAIREQAKRLGVTPYIFCLSGFQALLYRYSGQSQFLLGTPASGRIDRIYEQTVGYLVNPIVLACQCQGEASFAQLVEAVKNSSRQALTHQAFSFSQVLELLNKPRDPARNPLFQHMFALTHVHQQEHQDWVQHTYLSEQRGAAFDLSLILLDDRTGFTGEWRYNSDLYQRESAQLMIAAFVELLADACHHSDKALNDLNIIPDQQRQQLLQQWNATEEDYLKDICIHQWFEAQVQKSSDKTALITAEESISYRELNQRANQVARFLTTVHGVKPDAKVGILLPRSITMLVAIWGTLKAGGAFVPLDPTLPEHRLQHICQDADLSCVLTDSDHCHHSFSCLLHVLDSEETQAQLLAQSPENLCVTELELTHHNLAYVIYTSGSTGVPKGVMVEHGSLVNQMAWFNNAYPSDEDDRFLLKTPFSFDVSLSEYILPLLIGQPLVIAKPEGHKEPQYLQQLIAQEQITKLHFVPALLQQILSLADLGQCSSLRQVFAAGEALSPAVAAKFYQQCPDAQLHNLYGPTEATIFATAYRCDPQDFVDINSNTLVPMGKPIQNCQTFVLDEQLKPVPVGMTGELYLAGVGLARGYLNRPALTQETFITAPDHLPVVGGRLYKTGDRVRWLPQGELQYLGRSDNQVKLRGLRIELGEIEQALLQLPEVDGAVVSISQSQGQNQKDAQLVCHILPGQLKHRSEPYNLELAWHLRQALAATLPEYMLPNGFYFVSEFATNSSGKIDRNALPQVDLSKMRRGYQAPQTDTEMLLVQLWQDALNLPQIGVQDNFFMLGGNSLTAAKILAELQQRLAAELSLKMLFEKSTLGDLAAEIDRQQEQANPSESLDRMDSLLAELGA